MSTDATYGPNPLLYAMASIAQADRIAMDGDAAGITVTFWRGDTKVERFIADDDPAMEGDWEQIAIDARDALAA